MHKSYNVTIKEFNTLLGLIRLADESLWSRYSRLFEGLMNGTSIGDSRLLTPVQ